MATSRLLGVSMRRLYSGSCYAGDGLKDVVVVAAKRTPIGAFQGSLANFTACQLGSAAIKAALQAAQAEADWVEEVYMGNVLSSGLGQAPARQAALGAGLSPATICTTVNKVCASGMKAVMLGAQSIAMGLQHFVVAGGMESMSNAPFLLPRIRSTKVTGDLVMKDSMFVDGLQDAYKRTSMGICAESCAQEMGISRYDQDSHAIQSYKRALAAQASGLFNAEITPLTIVGKNVQDSKTIEVDEECSKFNPEKLRSLPSAFLSDGTVTAGNSSTLGDGSAVLLLASTEFAKKKGLPVLARIRGFGDAAQAPEKFPTTPALAIPKALQNARLQMKNVELFEINEAFSVVDLANRKLLGLSDDQVNIHGGAVSLGHPIGSSGARIIVSLITILALQRKTIGLASICNGGGGASALVLEREPTYCL